jgi:hypothetical protein
VADPIKKLSASVLELSFRFHVEDSSESPAYYATTLDLAPELRSTPLLVLRQYLLEWPSVLPEEAANMAHLVTHTY